MEFNLNVLEEKIEKNEFARNFIKELGDAVNNIDDKKLTVDEELEYEKKEFDFLQEYFEKELLDQSNGEAFIVTNRYENDELHRYKLAQYKDNIECKYIALEEDLPEDVELRDVVRKIDGKYILDKQATQYIKERLNKVKQVILDKRNKI